MALRNVNTYAEMAAMTLFVTAGLAIGTGIAFAVLPLPQYMGINIPALYRFVLAVLAIAGGGMHYLAGRWCIARENLFRTSAATLVGMVVLQISAPLDLLALGFLVLGRDEFES